MDVALGESENAYHEYTEVEYTEVEYTEVANRH
jgi:hypothetical protein